MYDFEQIESSQRQHDQVLLQNERICNEGELHSYRMFKALGAHITKDGNEWCALFGDDLQVGIAGFGKSPHDAILNWAVSMKEVISE